MMSSFLRAHDEYSCQKISTSFQQPFKKQTLDYDNTNNHGSQGICFHFVLYVLQYFFILIRHSLHGRRNRDCPGLGSPFFSSTGTTPEHEVALDPGATTDEAHVSAPQQEAQEHAWIPGADGKQGWAKGSGPPPRTRAEEAHRER
jgi:hypothetical protein